MPTVKLFANLRKIAGCKELAVPGGTVGEVLRGLLAQSPGLGEALFEEERLRPHVLVTLNGRHLQDLQSPVLENDQIAIFPPIAGG